MLLGRENGFCVTFVRLFIIVNPARILEVTIAITLSNFDKCFELLCAYPIIELLVSLLLESHFFDRLIVFCKRSAVSIVFIAKFYYQDLSIAFLIDHYESS